MGKKFNLFAPKAFFIMAQSLIFVSGLSVMFFVMALGHKKNALDMLSAKLDSTAESIAAELRSNQAPNVPISDEYGVFIVNVSDGTIVIDHRKVLPEEQALWEGYRSKFIYEMQKQKRGWIVYPEETGWGWNQRRKLIRYVPIDEMGWILAVEISKPGGFELLNNVIHASSYGTILLVILSGFSGFWLLTHSYLSRIEKSMSYALENNMLSLNGEEKFWDQSRLSSVTQDSNLDKEITGESFEPVVTKKVQASNIDHKIKQKEPLRDITDESVTRRNEEGEAALEKKTVPLKPNHFIKEELKPSPGETRELPNINPDQPLSESAINVNEIKSSALKKMIQQLRGK